MRTMRAEGGRVLNGRPGRALVVGRGGETRCDLRPIQETPTKGRRGGGLVRGRSFVRPELGGGVRGRRRGPASARRIIRRRRALAPSEWATRRGAVGTHPRTRVAPPRFYPAPVARGLAGARTGAARADARHAEARRGTNTQTHRHLGPRAPDTRRTCGRMGGTPPGQGAAPAARLSVLAARRTGRGQGAATPRMSGASRAHAPPALSGASPRRHSPRTPAQPHGARHVTVRAARDGHRLRVPGPSPAPGLSVPGTPATAREQARGRA